MRRQTVPAFARLALSFVLSLAVLSLVPVAGHAGDLIDVLPGLYGGDGITLNNPFHDAHFQQSSLDALNSLSQGIASSLNIPNLGTGAQSFTFDVQQAVFVNSTQSLGPLYSERAETIGEGKFNFAWTYTRLSYSRFMGENLHDLNLTFPHEDLCSLSGATPNPALPNGGCPGGATDTWPSPGQPTFELDSVGVNINLDLAQDVYLFYGKYGITPNWEVGLILPVIHTSMSVQSTATINRSPLNPSSAIDHQFGLPGLPTCPAVGPPFWPNCNIPGADISTLNSKDVTTDTVTESKTGVGDLIVRTKYNFLHDKGNVPALAVLGAVRFDTGDSHNFTGAGNTGFQGYLIASKKLGMFSPHLNLGAELTTDGGSTDVWRVVAGSEFSPVKFLTFSADVLGQQSFNGNGVEFNGKQADKLWDVGVSLKVNPVSTLDLLAGVLFPINKDRGLRTDHTWTVGLQYTF